jgi:hypothetical protein
MGMEHGAIGPLGSVWAVGRVQGLLDLLVALVVVGVCWAVCGCMLYVGCSGDLPVVYVGWGAVVAVVHVACGTRPRPS